eukprot:gb/GECG01005292.1/.p1 GENE.gb/GECG01005292.1/~~gb/GECG01005292.1/.p1  ORF type:complete len:937 (+),score=124.51 gb/GECG01005292.1/:1-2811(+)
MAMYADPTASFTEEDVEDFETLLQRRYVLHDIYQSALRDAFTTITSQFRATHASLATRKRLCKAVCTELKRRAAVVKQSVMANLLAIQRREYTIYLQRVRMDAQACRQLKLQARESHRVLLFAAHLDAETESEVQLHRLSPPPKDSNSKSNLTAKKETQQYLRCKRAVLDNVRESFFPQKSQTEYQPDMRKCWHGLSVLDIFRISHAKMLKRFQGLQQKMQIMEAGKQQPRGHRKGNKPKQDSHAFKDEHHGTKGLFCRVSAESIPKLAAYGFGPLKFRSENPESLYSISQSVDPSTQEGVDSLFSGVAPFFATLHRSKAHSEESKGRNVMGKFATDAASTANPVYLPTWFSRSSTLESDRHWVQTGTAKHNNEDFLSSNAATRLSSFHDSSLVDHHAEDEEDEEALGLGSEIPLDLLDTEAMQKSLHNHWPGARDLDLGSLHTRFAKKRNQRRKENNASGYSYQSSRDRTRASQEILPNSSEIQYLALCRVLLCHVVEVDKVTPEIVEEHLDAALQAEKALLKEDTRGKASSFPGSAGASSAFACVDALYDKSRQEYLILRPSCVLPEFLIQFTFSRNVADLDRARETLNERLRKADKKSFHVVSDETLSTPVDLSTPSVTQRFPYWVGTASEITKPGNTSTEYSGDSRPITPSYQSLMVSNYSANLNTLYPSPAASLKPSPGDFIKWAALGAQSVNISQRDIENANVSPYLYLHVLRHMLAHIPGPLEHTFSQMRGISFLELLHRLKSEEFDSQDVSSNSLRDTEIALDWRQLQNYSSEQRINHVAGALNSIEKVRKAIRTTVRAIVHRKTQQTESAWRRSSNDGTDAKSSSIQRLRSSSPTNSGYEEDESPAAEEARMLRARIEELRCALWREKAQTAEIRAQIRTTAASSPSKSQDLANRLANQVHVGSPSKGGHPRGPRSAESAESKSADK